MELSLEMIDPPHGGTPRATADTHKRLAHRLKVDIPAARATTQTSMLRAID